MHFIDICNVLASVLTLTSSILQFRYNWSRSRSRGSGSIRNLSYDYIILQGITTTTLLTYTLVYFLQPVLQLYRTRYIFLESTTNTIPFNSLTFLFDGLALLPQAILLYQLRAYKSTATLHQGLSLNCIGFLILITLPLIYFIKCLLFQQMKINNLDIADSIWFISKTVAAVQYMPQIVINWTSESVEGLHSWWLFTCCGTVLLPLIGRVVNTILVLGKEGGDKGGYEWFELPINFPTWPVMVGQGMSLMIITIQLRFYRGLQNTDKIHYKSV